MKATIPTIDDARLSSDNGVNLRFRNVSYTVKEGFFRSRKKKVLDEVNGDFRSSTLTAIMGPSGAGKTSLMNILAGYTAHNVSGQIYTNGTLRDESSFKYYSCYVMQKDNLQPLLTVAEAMKAAADLKLGKQLTDLDKRKKIEEILTTMDLTSQRRTKTCNLSGGEKKRLSIALELITDFRVMFFDEPTSGLDCVSSKQCVLLLKKLAASHRTIICTIHQPSATILDLFDHLYIVDNGFCAYQGSVKNLLSYLKSIGLSCPIFHNPGDFVMEVINGDHGNYGSTLRSQAKNGMEQQWFNKETIQAEKVSNGLQPRAPTRSVSRSTSGSFNQILTLTKRTFLVVWRDKTLTTNRLATHLFIALFIGFLYYGVGREASNMLNNFRFMFFSLMFLMFTSFTCVSTTFPIELPIISKEHFNTWYSLKSYYIAVTIADTPAQIVATLIYGSITYYLTHQPVEIERIVLFLFMCILISLVSQSFGLLVGASMDMKHCVILGPFCLIPFLVFSGLFIQYHVCPPALRWLFHVSFLKYGFEGLVLSVLGGDRKDLPCNADYCHYVKPKKFLANMDMAHSSYLTSVIFLFALLILSRSIIYYILRYRVKRRREKGES